MPDSLQGVQKLFTDLDAKYNLLLAACTNETDRKALALQYSRAEAAYLQCVGQTLESDDPKVAVLDTQFTAASAVVAKAVQQMGNMCKVIDDITQAVDIAAKIVGYAFPGVKI